MATTTLSPANSATGVAIAGPISVTFNEVVTGTMSITLNSVSIATTSSNPTITTTQYTGSYSGLTNSTLYTISSISHTIQDL